MLRVVVGIAIIVAIALVGYRRTFTRLHLPAGARMLFLTGTEFIFIGAALGDQMIGLLDRDTLASLTPLFSLGLGFIGLIFGIQLERDKILRFPKGFFLVTLIQAGVTMAAVFVPFLFLLKARFPGGGPVPVLAALLLASTASCTAPTVLALLGREFRLTGARVMELLRYISSLDSLAGLTCFGLLFCLAHAHGSGAFDPLSSLLWFGFSLALGGAMGFLLHLLTQVRCSDEEMALFVTGMILFSGGIALFLRLSPLFVNTVMGVTLANLPGAKNRIFNLLVKLEQPLYVVFLLLAGALWKPGPVWSYWLAGLYLVLRFLGKMTGGYLAARITAPRLPAPRSMGLGLLSLGGVAIAMVMNGFELLDPKIIDLVVTVVLAAVIVNELVSPTLIKVLLRRMGEIER